MVNQRKQIVQRNAGYTPACQRLMAQPTRPPELHSGKSGAVAGRQHHFLMQDLFQMKSNTTSLRKSGDGYTLVEMLVTVAIFSLAFVAIGVIFIGFTTAQSRANSGQQLLNEGSFILETITREIRSNSIDYTCTRNNYASDHTYLCLRSIDGSSVHFRFSSGKLQSCVDYGVSPCSVGPWVDMNAPFMTITAFEFHTYPTVNPHDANQAESKVFQPLTTITMSIEAGKGRAKQHYDLQTAASSRVYNF